MSIVLLRFIKVIIKVWKMTVEAGDKIKMALTSWVYSPFWPQILEPWETLFCCQIYHSFSWFYRAVSRFSRRLTWQCSVSFSMMWNTLYPPPSIFIMPFLCPIVRFESYCSQNLSSVESWLSQLARTQKLGLSTVWITIIG